MSEAWSRSISGHGQEGIIIGYVLLIITSVGSIYFGSLLSVTFQRQQSRAESVETPEQKEGRFSMKKTILYPFQLSIFIISFYLIYKYNVLESITTMFGFNQDFRDSVPQDISATFASKPNYDDPSSSKQSTKWILNIFFFLIGSFSLYEAGSIVVTYILDFFKISRNEFFEFFSDTTLFLLSSLLVVWNFYNKNWIITNVIGVAFCLLFIKRYSVKNLTVGCVFLGVFFIYQIFWLYYGGVIMKTYVNLIDVPLELSVPLDLPEKSGNPSRFLMFNLSDMYFPGLFIALMCRFDFHHHPTKFRSYFWSSIIGYIIGLVVGTGVVIFFKINQPALLYLIPGVICFPILLALWRGETGPLFAYEDRLLRAIDVPG